MTATLEYTHGDWVSALRTRFPALFPEASEVSVKAGWRGLVEALCEQLQAEAARGHGQPMIRQIKQKYGELRVYLHVTPSPPPDSRFDALTDFAERLSTRVCEHCGAPGRLIVSGWYYETVCKTHEPAGARAATDE
jgi:hypothetical protein